jgi:predicted amidohydrolase
MLDYKTELKSQPHLLALFNIYLFLPILPMQNLTVATAQFENASGDKAHNLQVISRLAAKAAQQGAQVIAFHECSITGYTFARHLSKPQLLDIAEAIPQGDSIQQLIQIAQAHDIVILAGLFEKDQDDQLFKAYVCVDKTGLLAKYRKLHPFINPHLLPGDQYVVFGCNYQSGPDIK